VPGLERVPRDVRTTYLGEFTQAHAEQIVRAFEDAGIVWWSKSPGAISRIWEHGVRLFVDRTKLDEARALATEQLKTNP
jgi:hypothetical protein